MRNPRKWDNFGLLVIRIEIGVITLYQWRKR